MNPNAMESKVNINRETSLDAGLEASFGSDIAE